MEIYTGGVNMYSIEEKRKRIEAEIKRLKKYVVVNGGLAEKLIEQIAWDTISAEELQADVDEHGYTELFTQSERTDPYQRERPQVKQLMTVQKQFAVHTKLLFSMIVPVVPKDNKDNNKKELEEEFKAFCGINGKKK